MWLIAGLGNPGTKYSRTRHNVGFMVINEIALRQNIDFRERELYRIGKGSMGEEAVLLLEPLTFMNRSGIAVREVMKKHTLGPEKLIVVHDDIDMETGKLRIRKRGSSGGHRGIESIIQELGTREFARVKVGIGREKGIAAEDYVLDKFRRDELPLLKEAIGRASDALVVMIRDGIENAMNSFNKNG